MADRLRDAGLDVVRVSERDLATAPDGVILEYAIKENRLLVTLDEHFGDWVFLKLVRHPGVVRIKANPTSSENVLSILLPFLLGHQTSDMRNCLFIVSGNRVRRIQTN